MSNRTVAQIQTEATNLEAAASQSPKFAAYYRAKAAALWIEARTLIKQTAPTERDARPE